MRKTILLSLTFILLLSSCTRQNQNPLNTDSVGTLNNITGEVSESKKVVTSDDNRVTSSKKTTKAPAETKEIATMYGNLKYEELVIVIPGSQRYEQEVLVAEELNKLTLENINTKLNFKFIRTFETLPQVLLTYLNSGDGDLVYSCNANIFNSQHYEYSLPYLVSEGLVKDVTDLLADYAPSLNKSYHDKHFYRSLMRINDGIYSISMYKSLASVPLAAIRKNVANDNAEIETMEDLYALMDDMHSKGYKFVSYVNSGGLISMFANINNYYLLPSLYYFGGYIHDYEHDRIVRFEDTNIVNDMIEFYTMLSQYGVLSSGGSMQNNDKTGIILTNSLFFVPEDPAYNYFPLYKDKSFQINCQSMQSMVISANSKKPERALILFDYLFSDKEAYDMVRYGVEGVNYKIENGLYKRESGKGISLIPLFNQVYEPPSWQDFNGFRNAIDIYMNCSTIAPYDEIVYSDYTTSKQYRDMYTQITDEYKITDRDDIINTYKRVSSSEPTKEIDAFYDMLRALTIIDDYSEQIYNAIQDIFAES